MSTKARILNRKRIDHLFYHILDGFKSSHLGIRYLFTESVVNKDEYIELLEKNCSRLIDRIKEFEVAQKITCVFFACLFGYMQVSGEELDMRRTARARTTGGTRSVKGRRRNDIEDSSTPPIAIESV